MTWEAPRFADLTAAWGAAVSQSCDVAMHLRRLSPVQDFRHAPILLVSDTLMVLKS